MTGNIIGSFKPKYNLVGTYVPNSGKDSNDVKFDYRINTWDNGLQKWLNECNIYPKFFSFYREIYEDCNHF